MAINLQKIRSDLEHADPQIQTFALMSISRLSPELVDSASEIQVVYDRLQKLIASDNPDVVFLARKATNHVDAVFRPYLKEKRQAAGPPRDPRTMEREELLATLDVGLDPKLLSALVMRFVEVGRREDLSALAPFLGHEDDRVRSNVVEVYAALGSREHVDVLKPLLADRNNRVRGNVIMALVRLGETDVRRPLEEMLCMGMISMRETAVWALSQLKLPFIEDLVLRASHDPYDGVRLRATKTLGTYVTRRAIVRLKELMNDLDINICEAAVEGLRHIKRLHDEARTRGSAPAPTPVVSDATAPHVAPSAAKRQGPDLRAQPSIIEPVEVPPAPGDEAVAVAAPSPAPAPSPVPAGEGRDETLRELGTEIYQLCRMNEITHEALDNVFYEILRYQDFLRAYMVKKQKGETGDVNPRSAIEQLQGRIRESFGELGRVAAELIDRGKIRVPDDHQENVQRLVAQLRRG